MGGVFCLTSDKNLDRLNNYSKNIPEDDIHMLNAKLNEIRKKIEEAEIALKLKE